MNVFVTGASGFIGSHLCRELVIEGHRVIALSRSGRTEKIAPLLSKDNFDLHTGDIQDTALIARLIKDNQVKTVFHLAARLPEADDLDNPLPCFDVNVRGTISVLHAAATSGVASFIYASTLSVYSGPPQYLPVDEKHPAQPATVYGTAKLAGELASHLYQNVMKVVILRYSGVYGRGSRPSDVVPSFLYQALSNRSLTIFGDGKQSSDFVYVGDVVRATRLAWEKGVTGIYNIGGGRDTPIRELAKRIIEITGSRSRLLTVNKKVERPYRFFLDITKAQNSLGYSPLTLEEGLRRYIAEVDGAP